jgi:Holliday junction DNA helicase RuvA
MIGFIEGEVLFSDGQEVIMRTASGVGYQIQYKRILIEGTTAALYISHVIREDSETLFGFHDLRTKKLFEMLNSVKGVGPKSSYALLSFLDCDEIINAISMDDKKTLSSAPGLGPKASAQIILDLQKKIKKISMYSSNYELAKANISNQVPAMLLPLEEVKSSKASPKEVVIDNSHLLKDALLACAELGFKDEKVRPLAIKILKDNEITKPEQLLHLVLKEI